ncbi:MAG: NAD(P)-dependent oxidoreductase [Bdellovibrionota bacterium]
MEKRESAAADRHVLVVGGAGYIGSVLTAALLERGYRVRVLDALIYGNGRTLADVIEHPRFSFLRGDVCVPDTFRTAMEGITDVAFLASLVGDPICKKYPDQARAVNSVGPKRCIDALGKLKVDKFIFVSTCSNYGLQPDNSLATETSSLNPLSLYAETKVEVEQYIQSRLGAIDFCPVVLRLATAFGLSKRMRFDLTVNEFTREMALGRPLVVYDEDTWRPYCHTGDISQAIIAALEAPSHSIRGEVFNVGSEQGNLTKRMIVERLGAYFDTSGVTYKSGGLDARNYCVSFEKIQRVLGFKAQFSVEQTMTSLAAAIRSGVFSDAESARTFYGNYEVDTSSLQSQNAV